MMRLSAAWRKTSVKRMTGTAPEAMMSASTCPGPTEGSWSTSPTSSSAAWSGKARSRARISGTSTIEVSSTTSRSQSSGASSVRRKLPVLGSVSSNRWIVFASRPVLSDRRLAARPVGAHNAIAMVFARRILRIELTSVVLPTPGPPVITSTFEASATRTAAIWLWASASFVCFSTQGIALSASINGQGGLPTVSALRFSAISRSARYSPARKTQRRPDSVAARMGEAMEEVGGDGYLFSLPNVSRRTLAEIEDGLVPALQDRGLVRTAYAHQHLRDNLLAF